MVSMVKVFMFKTVDGSMMVFVGQTVKLATHFMQTSMPVCLERPIIACNTERTKERRRGKNLIARTPFALSKVLDFERAGELEMSASI